MTAPKVGNYKNTMELLPALWGLWTFHFSRGERSTALQVAEELLHRTDSQNDHSSQMMSHRVAGATLSILGRLDSARSHLEQALALYDPAQRRSLAALYGYDVRIASLCFLAFVLIALGYPSRAKAL